MAVLHEVKPERRAVGYVNRLTVRVRKVVNVLSAALFATFTLVIILQVFSRYVLNGSLIWSEELVRYLLVWCVLISAANVTEDNEHLKIDSISKYLSPRGRRIIDGVVHLVNIGFLATMCWQGLKYMKMVTFGRSAAMQLPLKYIYIAMPLGAILMILVSVVILVRIVSGEEQYQKEHQEGDELT